MFSHMVCGKKLQFDLELSEVDQSVRIQLPSAEERKVFLKYLFKSTSVVEQF